MTRAIASAQVVSLNPTPRPQRTLFGDALRRLSRNPLALIGVAIILLLAFGAIFAPLIAPYSPDDSDLSLYVTPPTVTHVLGTDDIGRDILSRLIYGARISLSVSGLAMVIALSVGTLAGLFAGYYGGLIDILVMRITDVFLAFPLLLLAIALVAALGPGENNTFIALGIVTWP